MPCIFEEIWLESSMQIRKTTIRDIDIVAQIWKSHVERNLDIHKVKKSFFDDSTYWFVADANDTKSFFPNIQAFAAASAENGIGHLAGIASTLEQRGIGSQILKHLEEELKKGGCKKVTLYVRKNNLKAQKFYDKNKYEITDIIYNHYPDDNDDAYLMEKSL